MTDTQPDRPGTSTPAWQKFLPAATFLVGLGLGSVVVAVSQTGTAPSAGGGQSAGPTPGASATPAGGAGDTVVTVPGACEDSAQNLREAASLLRESVGTVKDFAPKRLVEILNRLETLDNETRPLIDECSGVKITESPAPSPSS